MSKDPAIYALPALAIVAVAAFTQDNKIGALIAAVGFVAVAVWSFRRRLTA